MDKKLQITPKEIPKHVLVINLYTYFYSYKRLTTYLEMYISNSTFKDNTKGIEDTGIIERQNN